MFDAVTAAEDDMQNKLSKKGCPEPGASGQIKIQGTTSKVSMYQFDVWCSDCRRGQYAEQTIKGLSRARNFDVWFSDCRQGQYGEQTIAPMFDSVTAAEDNMKSKLPGGHNTKRGVLMQKNDLKIVFVHNKKRGRLTQENRILP